MERTSETETETYSMIVDDDIYAYGYDPRYVAVPSTPAQCDSIQLDENDEVVRCGLNAGHRGRRHRPLDRTDIHWRD